jgi:hypothetical protein
LVDFAGLNRLDSFSGVAKARANDSIAEVAGIAFRINVDDHRREIGISR